MTHTRTPTSLRVRLAAALLMVVGIAAGPLRAAAPASATIPNHPSKLVYQKLDWQAPLGAPYRHVLANGLRAYIAQDSSLPIITVVGYVRLGAICDPAGKEGLGALYARLLRTGGTAKYPPDSLDALVDLFAIRASVSLNETELKYSFSFLSEYLDTAMAVIQQVLFHPAFDPARLKKEQEIAIQGIKHRFDNPGPTLNVLFDKAMYPGQPNSRLATEKSVTAITRDDLTALQRATMRTANTIVGVSGKFDQAALRRKLEAVFPSAGPDTALQAFPAVTCSPAVRAVVVHKPITQAYVRMGLPLFRRPHPDFYPLQVLNMVFGGASFTSRLSSRVRSDKGLTYSIYSQAESNYFFPATYFIDFHTRTDAATLVITLIREEMKRIVTDGITETELADAKKTLVDAMPSTFRNAGDIVENYSWNEYAGRPDSIYRQYPEKINAVSRQQVLDMARKYLKADSFTYAIVADTDALFAADTLSAFSLRQLKPQVIASPDSLARR